MPHQAQKSMEFSLLQAIRWIGMLVELNLITPPEQHAQEELAFSLGSQGQSLVAASL